MTDTPKNTNRFGKEVITNNIPKDAPLASSPGHKLRTSNTIVDRKVLAENELRKIEQPVDPKEIKPLKDQKLEFVEFDDQVGVVRTSAEAEPEKSEDTTPNMFTGPSHRNKAERFRFDGHKMMHHLDRIQAWQNGEKFAPIHIDMGLTKFCNTACIYCYAVVQNMTKGAMIGRDALLNYVEDCGKLGVRSIGFIGDGEPTLNPTVYDATVLAAEVGVDTSMATNGLLLEMDRAHDLLKNMTWIRFNLSAGDAQGFKEVHQSRPESFDLLIEKIKELVRIKKENGYKCTLGLQMVLIPECYDQVLKEAELGAELGVDYFVIKHCSDSEYKEIGVDYSSYMGIQDMLKEAEALSNKDYVVQVKWNKILAAGESDLYKNGYRKYDVCHGTPFLLQISGNGKIYPCGPFFNKERFYIGDLHKDSFFDIVMGDRYWEVHNDVVASVDVHKDCAIGCRQDYVNKFLWDLKNVPEHVNFI
ncbi:MAG: radical SAM protein [Candidatus Nitrohelix vancouverensis]|uniref:Radical SAM protein n=1 Tax=Candidatus Nitrohelix vancouverensis TaxID=2705534 RepID=A0A7T0G3E3_9BACT|nr:MAG: radical SAM protein [Candidatus Nitrohelix vancouverensis]